MKLTRAAAAVGMAVAVAVSAAPPARAATAFHDGNWLFEQCEAAVDELGSIHCLIYIQGVADGAASMSLSKSATCPRTGVTMGQLVDIVHPWLKAHPERRQGPAAGLPPTCWHFGREAYLRAVGEAAI